MASFTMKKVVCLVLCSFVATCLAQKTGARTQTREGARKGAGSGAGAVAGASNRQLVPLVANLCKQSCSVVCGSIDAVCIDVPGFLDCLAHSRHCARVCEVTCGAVEQCGPNCDVYEMNCINMGFPQLGRIFCPLVGYTCDVNCIIITPQMELLKLIQESVGNSVESVQTFVLSFADGNTDTAIMQSSNRY